MSDIHLHADLYNEASGRRNREAETWVRDQANRRSAQRARSHGRNTGVRVRFIGVMARAMGVAEAITTNPAQPQRPAAAHKHPR